MPDDTSSQWVSVRKLSYSYYGYGASYGLPGDLKTIVTQHWDATAQQWVGDDTNYFRYYTGASTAHRLKRVLLPNAYAAFVAAYGDPDAPYNSNAGDGPSDPLAGYTCFYYEYDADGRVSERTVFGQSNETDYAVTLSTHSRSVNHWDRKTIETRLDGATSTVYVNYLGQTLLTDLYDADAQTHTLTYNLYDADGRRVLTAEPSAFVAQSGVYYAEDLPDLIDYAYGDSPYLSDTAGLFRITAHSGTFQVQEQTTTLPEVGTNQNGPGTSATSNQWFDDRGNLAWMMDELGRVTYHQYDSLTGRLEETIQDMDDATADALQLTIPTGWTLPASGGANQTTDYQYDAFGRMTQSLGPAHTADLDGAPTSVRTASWMVYNDTAHETRAAQGYAVESAPETWDDFTIVGPVSITKTDRDGRVIGHMQAAYSGTISGLAAATISQSDYTAWTAYKYQNTRLAAVAVYDDIPSGTSDPDADGLIGTAGVNYERTSYGYETFGSSNKGRRNTTVTPDGTVTRVVFDARGSVLETWFGTDDTGATDSDPTGNQATGNNMVQVAGSVFDADGNLAQSRSYFGSGASDYYTTLYQYDWRGRATDIRSPLLAGEGQGEGVVTHYELSNLGQRTWTKTYASADFTLSTGELRAQTNNLYDPLGRVYESRVYEVDPDDGTVGDYLPSKAWYDARRQVVKTATANGLFQKFAYDGLGRAVASFTSYDTDEAAYSDADDVSGDTVIQQSQTWYDQAGQTIATASYQRLPDDTSTTGALTAADSYATAAVVWYDGAGRVTATANYGREDVDSGLTHYFFNGTTGALIDTDSDNIPDVAEAAPPEPDSSDNYIVALTEYNAAGRAYRRIDNLDRITETQYDDAGRVVKTIQNYDDGTVEETDTDCDSTVDYEYDAGGRLVTMTAYNPKGSGNGVQSQATKYLYTSAVNASWQTAAVYPDSNDVLSQNSATKVWTITTDNGDHVSTEYDRLGRVESTTDQRGMVHDYTFDTAGRLAADTVTDLGESGIVDDGVLRIRKTYDDVGRLQFVTSYSDTSGTTAVNQVKYQYNGWGKLAREYEEHDGAVDGNTPYVEYNYEDGATGGVAKYVRLSEVTYPGGREVQYGYGTTQAIDDIISRVATIGDGTDTYAAYEYLGARRIATEDYEDIDVKLDHAADNFAALDRFGRVVDQAWTDYGASPDTVLDEFTYEYDRAGNRTAKANELNHDFDETYAYDSIDRLVSAERDNGFDQSWTLDGLGNFSGFDDDGSSQTRTANAVNEITGITGGWVAPEYDAAGNMISGPKPGSGTSRVHYLYDAWNRLVIVKADDSGDPGDTLAEYQYDGTNRRIQKVITEDGGGPSEAHYFYNQSWQLLEERFVDGQGATVASNQYVWSPRYIDALIVRFHDGNGDGDYLDTGDPVRYYTGDANFNVTATIDANTGDVAERYVYTAYGAVTVYSATWTNPTSPATDGPLYCGYFFDAETALYHVRNRYYDSGLSILVTRDPIVYKGTDINLYRYVGGKATIATDGYGLCPATCPVIGAGSKWRPGDIWEIRLEDLICSKKFWARPKAERDWCLSHLACCWAARKSGEETDAIVLTNNYYGSQADHTVVNAIVHCTWMCYVASMYSCSAGDALALGKAHEVPPDGATNPFAGMDLYNNSVGVGLASNGQSVTQCRDKCEQKAKEGKLYWTSPLPPGNPNPRGLPVEIPQFEVDDQGNLIAPS